MLPKLAALGNALGTIKLPALLLATLTIGLIAVLRMLRPNWPGILIGVVVATVMAWALALPVETIGTRFGGIPESIPWPALPAFRRKSAGGAARCHRLRVARIDRIAVVGGGRRWHDRTQASLELRTGGARRRQYGSALFGGICVTGLIARTATNVRAGARSPVAGMMHSLFLLLFILIAAPLASYIPLSALAAVLVVVAWTMAEKQEFWTLLRSSWGDAVVLLATFLLTVFRDLTQGILVGFALGAVLFINRMAEAAGIEAGIPLAAGDRADDANGDRRPYDASLATDPDVMVYRITGAFFFGAAAAIGAALDSIGDRHKAFVIDFAAVPLLDSTAANTIHRMAVKARRQGGRLFITGTSPAVRRALLIHGVRPPLARFRDSLDRAVADIQAGLPEPDRRKRRRLDD